MKKSLSTGILLLLPIIFCSYVHAADIYYVDDGALGSNTGEDWANAFTDLQDALNAVSSGDEIWVAAGTYYPSVEHGGSGDRYRSFQMINGVSIYGGFSGSETSVDQRDIQANPSILSGDIGVVGDASDNSYHVFYHSDVYLDETALLDGFTITGGNANGGGNDDIGGGMHNYSSSPTVINCTFSGNTAEDIGGGMSNYYSSSPTVINCTFSGNTAGFTGGGMHNYSSSPTLTNCTFNKNIGNNGAGMYNSESSSPMLTNCTFSGNMAFGGGGIYNYYSSSTLVNCIFSGNTADYGGGVANSSSSSPTLTNCTFSGNTANEGGGMCNRFSSSAILTNCILWGDISDEIYNYEDSTPSISYCNIQLSGGSGSSWNVDFGTDNGDNIDDDPLFIRNPNPGDDTEWGTADDDYGDLHLSIGSPCIDTGDPSASGDTDMDGETRVIDGDGDGAAIIDIGAYEFLDTDQDGISDITEDDDGGSCFIATAASGSDM